MMKYTDKTRSLLYFCLALIATVLPVKAAPLFPFEVSYFTTNYAASEATGSTADMANGLWLGNLRGNATWRDLIVANKGSNTVSIRFCNDNGTFGAITNYAVGPEPTAVRSADLNGDGFEDIIVANTATNTISILLSQSNSTFAAAADYVVGSSSNPEPIALATGDVTGEGDADIVVANATDNTVSILINEGTGVCNLWMNYAVGTRPTSVGLVDFNGDGLKDIYTANRTSGTISILLKAFDGTFGAPQTITLFSGGDPQPVQAVAADLDADGSLDIATVNYNSNTVSVLKGPAFTQITNYSVGSGPVSLLVRDLNRDSVPDIAVANAADNTISILLNANGQFQAATTKAVGASPAAIAGSNFDVGGFTDLAVANNGDNSISILLYDMPIADSQSFAAVEDQPTSITLHGGVFGGRTRSYTLTVQPTNGILTGTAPNLVYTPNADYFGPDSFSYTFTDGLNTSEEAPVSIDVLPANDAPSFSVSTNRIEVVRFGTTVIISNFVGNLECGATNETDQRFSFGITLTNASFFSIRPYVGTNLALNFKPSLNAEGTNVILVRVLDNGGTANGGINASPAVPVEIVVPPNPFKSFGGRYNGLFYETNGVQHDSSGFFNLSINSAGQASGRILLNKAYGFRTHFLADGTSQFTVSRGTNGSPLSLSLQLDSANQQIQGTVSDGVWTAELLGDRATFNIYTNPAPQAGTYTMLLDGGTNGAASPAGHGYAVVKVNTAGKVSLIGKLADGTAISQTAVLSKDGVWPLYMMPYRGRGSVLSWITFTNGANEDFIGNVSWIKTAAAGGTRYAAGFTNETVAAGSVYTIPGATTRVLVLNDALSILEGGGLSVALTNQIVLEANNVFTIVGGTAKQLSLVVNLNNGSLTGSFIHPTSKLATGIRGVVFQRRNTGGGYFLGPVESGKFSLTAP